MEHNRNDSESEKADRAGHGAEAEQGNVRESDSIVAHPATTVKVICDGCGGIFEPLPSSLQNRYTVSCPHCAWPAWVPRQFWPEPELPGGPLRPTIVPGDWKRDSLPDPPDNEPSDDLWDAHQPMLGGRP